MATNVSVHYHSGFLLDTIIMPVQIFLQTLRGVSLGFPMAVASDQQCNIGGKPAVILCTYIVDMRVHREPVDPGSSVGTS